MTFHLYCILIKEYVSAVSDEDLTKQQHTQDQETASQKPQSEREYPPDSPPHTEPKDDGGTCDASQQGYNLSDDRHSIMDKDGGE